MLPTVSGRVRAPGAYRHIAIHFDIKSTTGSTHVDRLKNVDLYAMHQHKERVENDSLSRL